MTATDTPTNGNGTPTGQALEVQSPRAMVEQYRDSFAAVLPSHIAKPETWIRLAQGALKKGRLMGGGDSRTELEAAAANNPGVFLATLLDCARLGLEPGTEQYYLTPRKVKGRLEILGIVGYQGLIELMYRAGAVESVVAECVYSNDPTFVYRPGVDIVPQHEIDWDSDDRGELRLVYAYARMIGGATSKVVVLNKSDIAKIKAKAQNPNGEYSPWRTDPSSMWLKSAVRQLRKWVPTSAEYRREQLRAAADVADERAHLAGASALDDLPAVDAIDGDVIEGEVVDEGDDVVDAEVVEPDGDQVSPGREQGEGEEAPGSAGPDVSTPEPDGGDDFPDVPAPEPPTEPEPAAEPEPEPEAETEAPAEAPPKGAINANDIARYARQVFKADYEAAPNGQKTRVVERLRHAIVFAQSGGKSVSLNDLEPADLFKVNERLRDIAGGKLTYTVDDDGVTLQYKASDRTIPITWAQVEALETAGSSS